MTARAASGGARPFRMISGVSKLADLADGMGALGNVVAAGGTWYYCDPTNGTGNGGTAETATASLETAYGLCRNNKNDGVFFIGGATAFNPTAAFDWTKSYTHLIGLSADLPGKGQRCRVVGLAATDLTQVMTFSGSGNVIANIQFNNEETTGAIGSATVTGLRNLFVNCFFMNPTSTTAAAFALKVSGSENTFVRCSIGQITNSRTGASYGLHLLTAANSLKFIGCEFQSWSDQNAHVPVFIATSITAEGWQLQFEDCLFQNLGNANLSVGISDGATNSYHQIIFRGRNNSFVKIAAVSSQLGYTYANDMSGSGSGLLYINVNEG